MSDYNVQDKVEGSQWTPQEHNAMKIAVNSKMDKDNLVQNLLNPSGTQFPSTQAVADALAGSFTLKGNLIGPEQIKTGPDFQYSGYWVALKMFDTVTPNSEYPVKTPGVLRILKNADHKILEYITIADHPRYFICTNIDGQPHSEWIEIATSNFLTVNHYCKCNGITAPPSVSVTDNNSSGIYTLDQISGDSWSKAVVRVSSSKPLLNTDIVSAEFSWPDSVLEGKMVLVGNYMEKNCDLVITEKDDKVFTVTALNFSSQLDSDVNEFYFTILIQ